MVFGFCETNDILVFMSSLLPAALRLCASPSCVAIGGQSLLGCQEPCRQAQWPTWKGLILIVFATLR